MIKTTATIVDNATDGGESIDVTIRADDDFIYLRYLEGMQGWTIRVRRGDVLAAVETEEHG